MVIVVAIVVVVVVGVVIIGTGPAVGLPVDGVIAEFAVLLAIVSQVTILLIVAILLVAAIVLVIAIPLVLLVITIVMAITVVLVFTILLVVAVMMVVTILLVTVILPAVVSASFVPTSPISSPAGVAATIVVIIAHFYDSVFNDDDEVGEGDAGYSSLKLKGELEVNPSARQLLSI